MGNFLFASQAIQYILRNNNVTNIAPRAFAFTHLAMWQALRANNESAQSRHSAPPEAVASENMSMCTACGLLNLERLSGNWRTDETWTSPLLAAQGAKDAWNINLTADFKPRKYRCWHNI